MASSAVPIDLCAIPAGVSPNGVYNFVNPPSLFTALLVISVALGAISTIFVLGRLFVNRKKLKIADYMTFIGCITNITYTGLILARPDSYRHIWDTPVCDFNGQSLKILFVQTMFFGPVFFFTKAAILLLYSQLFAIETRFRIAIYISILVTLLLYLSEFPLAAVYAAPRPGHSWDSLLENLTTNAPRLALGGAVQSAISTALDIYIFILPLPILLKLQMMPRQRLQVLGIFSTALLGVGASVASLIIKIRLMSSADSSWLGAQATMCTIVETNIALIVGCMPAFAHFVSVYIRGSTFIKTLRSRLMSGTGRTRNVSAPSKDVITFGSNQPPRRNNYFELTDTMLLETRSPMVDGRLEMDHHAKSSSTQSGVENAV
ncbi:hypothetical protein TMatcc_002055 [Talaromyces marneffei ATCC 18224]|uniref:Rhodopsin domain-containing protein n=1 Tax=Talaromyces marneffei (strain ATCC 18224 / CBS 334.59 / QM 7333) TaxID=441960 RepID=B6QIK3_TALMQ|nr:uncharacterized protein EYB26_006766 [Talaromyces marneffei]EEA23198.1 hypothetical protein PMAA_097870 [Talaromyces marneffei ATCC 18224]KAE8552048.1 hypothetical protein EYB25_005939 [Talaromyces marneffei]QGA19078.1 hypothetical protein EYB26_006766 [Talaromyces marneffei]